MDDREAELDATAALKVLKTGARLESKTSVAVSGPANSPLMSADVNSMIHRLQCINMKLPREQFVGKSDLRLLNDSTADTTSPCRHRSVHQGQMPGRHRRSATEGLWAHNTASSTSSTASAVDTLTGEASEDEAPGSSPRFAMRKRMDSAAEEGISEVLCGAHDM